MTSPWISDTDLAKIRERHEAIDQDEFEDDGPCEHLSASGVDRTDPSDPNKVWRCDQCGYEFTTPANPGADNEGEI